MAADKSVPQQLLFQASAETGTSKQCSQCKEIKPVTDFPVIRKWNVIRSWCKKCHTQDGVRRVQRKRAAGPEYQAKEREYSRKRRFKKKYGITVGDYNRILEEQGGVCAICGKPSEVVVFGTPKLLVVDHDHVTGVVRGILCDPCNRGIGLLRDNPEILRRAADYLTRSGRQVSRGGE